MYVFVHLSWEYKPVLFLANLIGHHLFSARFVYVMHKHYLMDDTRQEQYGLVRPRGSVSDPRLTCTSLQMHHAHCRMKYSQLKLVLVLMLQSKNRLYLKHTLTWLMTY